MTAKTLEEEAREYATSVRSCKYKIIDYDKEQPKRWSEIRDAYLAAATARDKEIEELRAELTEAKSAIRWMHGYDEPGTDDFPICPEGKRFAWRIVARQQFAIVREACREVVPPIPLPGEGG